jgi:uncharacterized protein YkwD
MPTIPDLRRLALAAVAFATMGLAAGPAHAAGPHRGVPCIKGVTCPVQPPAKGSCPNADVLPAPGNLRKVERATLCLINRQRVAHGRHRLHANATLRGVAAHYSHRMVVQSFFAHVSPSGSTFDKRIRDAGYLRGTRGWALGENIAWGAGVLATPRAIVRAWMHSPEHRRNILNGRFRDAGLGVSLGLPVPGLSGATYANEFGQRIR